MLGDNSSQGLVNEKSDIRNEMILKGNDDLRNENEMILKSNDGKKIDTQANEALLAREQMSICDRKRVMCDGMNDNENNGKKKMLCVNKNGIERSQRAMNFNEESPSAFGKSNEAKQQAKLPSG